MFCFNIINYGYTLFFALNVLGDERSTKDILISTSTSYENQTGSIFEGTPVETAINYDIYDSNNRCKKIKHTEKNFSSPARRISEVKCLEYIWRTKIEENEVNLRTDCSPRITVGGRPAFQGEFPHMGAVGWRSAFGDDEHKWEYKCGASLISDKFMLTAAHCSYVSARDDNIARPEPEVVKMGDKFLVQDGNYHDLYRLKSFLRDRDMELSIRIQPKIIRIERILKHKEYHAPKLYYDIALLELAESVKFGPLIRPACLWSNMDTTSLGALSVSGWGVVDPISRRATNELQVAKVGVINSSSCDELLQWRRNRNWQGLTDHQICAGYLPGGIDTCQGDSGGPLQVKMNLTQQWPMYFLVGITSFGYGCARSNTPSVYTRTAGFVDWIESNVWPDVK